jgi:hypothetical protein
LRFTAGSAVVHQALGFGFGLVRHEWRNSRQVPPPACAASRSAAATRQAVGRPRVYAPTQNGPGLPNATDQPPRTEETFDARIPVYLAWRRPRMLRASLGVAMAGPRACTR